MPVNFKDFYNFATNGTFSRGAAIVMSDDSTAKFKVSDSDHRWAIMRSSDDKKLNNDIRNAFYQAVSEQCKGSIPRSVLSALNIGDFKFDTSNNASSGKPLTAYRIKQVITAMRKEGIEMPQMNLIDEPIVDEANDNESLALEKSAIQNDGNSSRIIIDLDDSNDGQIKINDIGLEKGSEEIQEKESEEKPELVQQEEAKKPQFTREERLLRSYLGYPNMQDILKGIPEDKRGEAKSRIEAALQVKEHVDDALISVVRHLNTIKFEAMLENGDEEIWCDIESYLYNEYENKEKECLLIDDMAQKIADDFKKEWLGKDTQYANKPLTTKGLALMFLTYFEKQGPKYEEAFHLFGKINWGNEVEWEN